ncbi:MAG TPA: hypothetical protein VJM31_19705 [Vicinamibacterales bacterium]|nr:hypothetical protein [Vicinamibacterales bacterium]
MKLRTFNKVVRCSEANTPTDVAALLERLPVVARRRVESDLELRGQAQHYDSSTGEALYFTRRGTDLTVWAWCCMASHDEAAKLLIAIDGVEGPLNEQVASSVFTRATGRTVNEPHPPGRL